MRKEGRDGLASRPNGDPCRRDDGARGEDGRGEPVGEGVGGGLEVDLGRAPWKGGEHLQGSGRVVMDEGLRLVGDREGPSGGAPVAEEVGAALVVVEQGGARAQANTVEVGLVQLRLRELRELRELQELFGTFRLLIGNSGSWEIARTVDSKLVTKEDFGAIQARRGRGPGGGQRSPLVGRGR